MVIAVANAGLAYAPVPKAGCSSVKAMLAQVDPDVTLPNPDKVSNRLFHAMYPTRRYNRWRFRNTRDLFRFTVVRDPLKRLMSVYTNKVVHKKELFNSRKIRTGVADLPPDPDPDFFFQNLAAYIDAASVIKHHALPTRLFTGQDLGGYDVVFRTSEMDDVARTLSERTKQKVQAVRVNSSEVKLDFQDLKWRTVDALRPFVADEYAHLKDYFENPLI